MDHEADDEADDEDDDDVQGVEEGGGGVQLVVVAGGAQNGRWRASKLKTGRWRPRGEAEVAGVMVAGQQRREEDEAQPAGARRGATRKGRHSAPLTGRWWLACRLFSSCKTKRVQKWS